MTYLQTATESAINPDCETCSGTGVQTVATRVYEGGEWGDFTEEVACTECFPVDDSAYWADVTASHAAAKEAAAELREQAQAVILDSGDGEFPF